VVRRQRTEVQQRRGRLLAERIREWRTEAGGNGEAVTQDALATRSGVQVDTIRRIEASKVVDPGFSVVALIVVRGLGRSLDELAEQVLSQ
jgi:transcriptional regulator with XRE-family HTH domain